MSYLRSARLVIEAIVSHVELCPKGFMILKTYLVLHAAIQPFVLQKAKEIRPHLFISLRENSGCCSDRKSSAAAMKIH